MSSYKDIVLSQQSDTSRPAIEFLVEHGVIKNTIPCPTCTLRFLYKKDGYAYSCTHKGHNWDFQTKVVQINDTKILQTAFCLALNI